MLYDRLHRSGSGRGQVLSLLAQFHLSCGEVGGKTVRNLSLAQIAGLPDHPLAFSAAEFLAEPLFLLPALFLGGPLAADLRQTFPIQLPFLFFAPVDGLLQLADGGLDFCGVVAVGAQSGLELGQPAAALTSIRFLARARRA